jgi:prephenate dehydrogenase
MTEMRDVLAGTQAAFIGSHPICGSEQQGVEVARDDLYRDALVVVTHDKNPIIESEERVCAMWQAAGAVTRVMDPAEHDELLARTSHLPHFAAACLVMAATDDVPLDVLGTFAGTGYMDSTRIAEGAPGIWRDILATNQEPIVRGLTRMRDQVDELLQRIQDGGLQDVETYLEESRSRRKQIRLQREQLQGDRDGECHRSEEC